MGWNHQLAHQFRFKVVSIRLMAEDGSRRGTTPARGRICEDCEKFPGAWRWVVEQAYIPVVPGQAGGGSFQKEKNYRMSARRPTQRDAQIIFLLWTSLLPFHGGDVLCFEVKCFDVLMSVAGSGHVMVTSFDAMSWLVLCHVTWCNAMSWWWAVLLQYYSVLQSTTPILLQYYPVLLQYYLVLQSPTPVLTCTTKYYSSTNLYYSSTTLYYKVLLQYYPVLQSSTGVGLCSTR